MTELKTTLRRMGVYYLLLALDVIACANVIPDRFPLRNLSAIYLLAVTVCLVLYYAHRLPPTGSVSRAMKALSWMGLLMILLRGVKYAAVSEVGVLARHTWYLYYVPLLLLPLLLFYVSLFVRTERYARARTLWRLSLFLTVVLILAVLTNDLHRLVFRFRPGFEGWDSDYSYGPLFYVVNGWQYALYLAAIVLLVVKCRVGNARRQAWVLLLPFTVGVAMILLLITGTMPKLNGTYIVEFPEVLICMAAAVLEGCIQLGLIPTNTDYSRLFPLLSIRAQITDRKGKPVYLSHSAAPLSAEQFTLSNGARLDTHTVLRRMKLPGGFGFWQDDMTELDRLNTELAEAKEGLAQEAELIRLRSDLKERQAKLEQRTLMYDTIAKRTQRQSQLISRLAKEARLSDDGAFKNACRGRITLLGAYIKRYANLTLLSQEQPDFPAGELALSVSEVLRYLNFCGIPGELISSADCAVPAPSALAAFEAFEDLLETKLPGLRGVFVNLSGLEHLTFKLTLEGAPEDEALSGKQEETVRSSAKRLFSVGILTQVRHEDGVTYVCLTLPRGGDAA